MNFMACFVRDDVFYFCMPGGVVPDQSRCEVTTYTPSSDASCRPAIQVLSYTQCTCEVNAANVAKGTEVELKPTATIKLFCVLCQASSFAYVHDHVKESLLCVG